MKNLKKNYTSQYWKIRLQDKIKVNITRKRSYSYKGVVVNTQRNNDVKNHNHHNKGFLPENVKQLLVNGPENKDRFVDKYGKGIYMVVFSSLYLKGKQTLIYKYIKYKDILALPIITYAYYIAYPYYSSYSKNDDDKRCKYIPILDENLRNKHVHCFNHIEENLYNSIRTRENVSPKTSMDEIKYASHGRLMILSDTDKGQYIKACLDKNISKILDIMYH